MQFILLTRRVPSILLNVAADKLSERVRLIEVNEVSALDCCELSSREEFLHERKVFMVEEWAIECL